MKKINTQYITQAAIIAAAYAALTIALAPISYGNLQVRVAEALTVLPAVLPSAIPGLFIGCVIANTLGPGAGIWDIVFGSLATLLAAWLSYKLRKYTFLVPIPPIVINALVIGLLLFYVVQVPLPLPILMLQVGVGQTIACYALGMPLLLIIKKRQSTNLESH